MNSGERRGQDQRSWAGKGIHTRTWGMWRDVLILITGATEVYYDAEWQDLTSAFMILL